VKKECVRVDVYSGFGQARFFADILVIRFRVPGKTGIISMRTAGALLASSLCDPKCMKQSWFPHNSHPFLL
jgi:hypothetical protein